MESRKRNRGGKRECVFDSLLTAFVDREHSVSRCKIPDYFECEEAVRIAFSEEARCVPWKRSGTASLSSFARLPLFKRGTGSCHTNGRALSEKVLYRLNICVPAQPLAQFLLFMDVGDDMYMHVDPLIRKKKNVTKTSLLSMDIPAGLPFRVEMKDIKEMIQCRVLAAIHEGLVTVHVETLLPGDVICFMGTRLHAVYNEDASFSFGNHYALPSAEGSGGDEDELVLYGLLSGKKHVAIFSFPDREMDFYVDSLNLEVTPELCTQETSLSALFEAVSNVVHE